MIIKNKIESVKFIKELKLNQFPEKLVTDKEKKNQEVLDFIQKHPVEFYTLRDKSKSGGPAFHIVNREDVLNKIKVYKGPFSILESSYNYKDNQLMVGEVLIKDESVNLIASFNGELSIREMYAHPDICLNTTIFDDRSLKKARYFDEIYKFINEKNLQGVIVEFGYFNKKVGKNKENFIIYEIRTSY